MPQGATSEETVYRIQSWKNHGGDGIQRRAFEVNPMLRECLHGVRIGQLSMDATSTRILSTSYYYWPILFEDVKADCNNCKTCQLYGRRSLALDNLHPITPTGPSDKWGVDFMGPLPMSPRRHGRTNT